MKSLILVIFFTLTVLGAPLRDHDVGGKDPSRNSNQDFSYTIPNVTISSPIEVIGGVALSKEIEETSKNNIKKLEFDPILRIEGNNGGFSTSFSYSLPPSKLSLNAIEFTYFTSFREDGIFGHGWRWDLPKITQKNSSTKYPYSIEGQLENGSLLQSSFNKEFIREELNSILQGNTNVRGTKDFNIYQLDYDDTHNLYIHVNEQEIGWVVFKLNGEKWIFNNLGDPVKVIDLNGNSISLQWNNTKLNSISYPFDVKILFDYGEGGKLVKITSISNEDKSVFNFNYANNQLIYAGYENGVIPVFQGKYSNFQETIKATTELFEIDPDKKEVENEKVDVILNSSDTSKNLYINYKDYVDEINNIIKSQKYDEKGLERFVKDRFLGDKIKKMFDKVRLYTEYRGENLELPEAFKPFKLNVRVHDSWDWVTANCGEGPCRIRLHIRKNIFDQVEKRNLLLLDMNNDGQKDLVSCPINGDSNQFANFLLGSMSPDKFSKVSLGKIGPVNVGFMDWGDWKTTYKLKNTTVGEFECNQNTLFVDWNKDGRVDILNGNELTLNFKDSFDKITLSDSDLNAKFTTSIQSINKTSKLMIRDLNSDSTFEIYDFKQIKDKEIELRQNVGILSEILSPFEGKVQIDYRMYKNKYLLASSFKYVGDEYTEEEKIYYKGAQFNKDDFLGFSEIIKIKEGANQQVSMDTYCKVGLRENLGVEKRKIRASLCQSSQFQSVEELIEYQDDSSDTTILQHAPVITLNDQGISPLEYNPENIFWNWSSIKDPFTDLLSEINYSTNPIVKKSSTDYKNENDRFVISKTKSSTEYLSSKDKIIDSASTEITYLYRNVIPEQIISKSDTTEKVVNQINDSKYLAMRKSREVYSDKNLLSRFSYENDLNRNLVMKVQSFSAEDLVNPYNETNYSYDHLGRLENVSSFEDEMISYSYILDFMLPVTETSPGGKISTVYNLTNGAKKEVVDFNANKTIKEYSSDGFTLEVNYNGNSVYVFSPPVVLTDTYPSVYAREFTETKKDVTFSSKLNSMGRVIELVSNANNSKQNFKYSLMGKLLSSDNEYVSVKYENLLNCKGQKTYSSINDKKELSRENGCKTLDTLVQYTNNLVNIKKNEKGLLKYSQNGRSFIYPNYDTKKQTLKSLEFLPYEWNSKIESTNLTRTFLPFRGASLQKREFDNKTKMLKDEYGQLAKIHKNGQLSFYESQSDFVLSIKNEFQGANIKQTNIGLFDFFYTYERGLVSEVKFINEKFAYSYDEYDRLNSFTWGDSTYSLHYDHSKMISINPFISKIQRDSRDLVTSINFTNDLTLNYERDELGRIINQVFKNNEKEIYSSSVSYLVNKKSSDKVAGFKHSFLGKDLQSAYKYFDISMKPEDLVRALVQSSLNSTFSTFKKIKGLRDFPNPRDFIKDYLKSIKIAPDTKELVPRTGNLSALSRNSYLQASKVRDLEISYVNDNPVSIKNGSDEIFQFFLPTGEMVGSCINTKDLDVYSTNCWFKISDDNFIIKGRRVSLLRVDSIPSVLIIDDKSYPVVTDFRGSVTSVINSKTGDVLFARDYDINGLKKIYYNKSDLKLAKEVENLTIWSFAHLFENPFLSNEDLYFSKTRTLSARNGEWLTFDPMIKWNVEQLLNSPVDFNGFKYVNGDPVNFVDPSGYAAIKAGISASGSFFRGVEGSYEVAASVDLNPVSKNFGKIEIGAVKSKTVKLGIGAGVSVGLKGGISFGNDNIKDLGGNSGGLSFSAPFLKIGGSSGIGVTDNGTPTTEISVTLGTPTEFHIGGGFSETDIMSETTIFKGLWNGLFGE